MTGKSGHEVDVLISRFEQHAEQLRHLDLYDLKVAGGYLTVQLLLGSWFAARPIGGFGTKIALIGIDLAFLVVCEMIIWASHNMRLEARQIIRKINSTLGLNKPGADGKEPIYIDREPKRFWGYLGGMIVAFLGGATIVLLASPPDNVY